MTPTLVIATHNAHKLEEFQALLAGAPFALTSCGVLGLPEPEETGDTFIANAELKARAAADACGLPTLADDSGLVVPALGGAPGIYSARWAGPGKDFAHAMQRVEDGLRDAIGMPEGASAYFVCALSLSLPGGATWSVEGRAYGWLTFPPRGGLGFGYDPIFVPETYAQTYGEIDPTHKNAISHRARAFGMFTETLLPKLIASFLPL